MKLAIVCALPQEHRAAVRAFALAREGSAGSRIAQGTRGPHRVLSILSGPGPGRAAAAAGRVIASADPDMLVDFGTCASVDPKGAIGDIVLATRCVELVVETWGRTIERGRWYGVETPAGMMRNRAVTVGIQASGRVLVGSEAKRRTIRELTGAVAANWETAAVFRRAVERGVPALSLRVVTDLGDRRAFRDFRRQVNVQSARLAEFLAGLVDDGWLEEGAFAGWLEEALNLEPVAREEGRGE